ncbi:hypothetical protein GCM10022409_47770 [Hymenobacter glaciei]|uniref:Uncharacterized protein n=1 Tax=Hymenobacter glaciei TaxID=877209 RepID=A0ABP7UXG1_9BACT
MPPPNSGGPARATNPTRPAGAPASTRRPALAAPGSARTPLRAAAAGRGFCSRAFGRVFVHPLGLAFALGLGHGFHGWLRGRGTLGRHRLGTGWCRREQQHPQAGDAKQRFHKANKSTQVIGQFTAWWPVPPPRPGTKAGHAPVARRAAGPAGNNAG